jgi:AcrR family transcriptional regulator
LARPLGRRDEAYETRRDELLDRLEARLIAPDGHQAGLRALAEAVGVSYPTLRHYFGSRAGILEAFFARRAKEGASYIERMASTDLPFAASIAEAVNSIAGATRVAQFRALHDIGLREGLLQNAAGTLYLDSIFEPTLQAIEKRLEAHIEKGEMRQTDARFAALSLLSPIILGSLHQNSLAGAALRTLDLDAFAAQLAERFITAYAL